VLEPPRNLVDLHELAAAFEAAGIYPTLMLDSVQDDRGGRGARLIWYARGR